MSMDTVVKGLDLCTHMNYVCVQADDLSSVWLLFLFCSTTCRSTLAPCLFVAKTYLNSAHLSSEKRAR